LESREAGTTEPNPEHTQNSPEFYDYHDVSWEEAREANLRNWEERVPLHESGYGVEEFANPGHLSQVVRDDLAALRPFVPGGSLDGLEVCHLQCHIGTDTVSLARAGAARVVGVDFSPSALESARRLAQSCKVNASWVQSDVLDARAAVQGQFDLVYTSIGAICWLNDLGLWAKQIAALLRPGGLFYIRDGHPMLLTVDENAPEPLLRYRYFGDGTAQAWDDDTTYVGDGKVASIRTYEWPHSISEILNALIAAGLKILKFDEGRTLPWQFSPLMEFDKEVGSFVWPEQLRNIVPCTFTVIATLG
jgi:2-polyprenyl-3-methyl-5-hydroxy-6-metoxy-1,4-benzoquinol methylase